MSYESVRAAVAAHVKTNWDAAATGYPIEFENIEQIDHSKQSAPFVTYQLKWRNAVQASIENTPITRYDGEAVFHIHVPQGEGTKVAMQIADVIAGFMKYRQLIGVQFLAPRLLPSVEYQGWSIWPLAVGFHYRE